MKDLYSEKFYLEKRVCWLFLAIYNHQDFSNSVKLKLFPSFYLIWSCFPIITLFALDNAFKELRMW